VISILVVGPSDDLPPLVASIEVLRARDAEDAVEKLARNRRIDAILLLQSAPELPETVRAILEENPAPPPIYVPEEPAPPGAHALGGGEQASLLSRVLEEIQGSSR
jgi:hypothetical protein